MLLLPGECSQQQLSFGSGRLRKITHQTSWLILLPFLTAGPLVSLESSLKDIQSVVNKDLLHHLQRHKVTLDVHYGLGAGRLKEDFLTTRVPALAGPSTTSSNVISPSATSQKPEKVWHQVLLANLHNTTFLVSWVSSSSGPALYPPQHRTFLL